jgi:DNA (cytosine-5)-methyltransferase 1
MTEPANTTAAAARPGVRVDPQVRPRLLDLFCCAGGAAMGYRRAGFEVVGVDINPQPRYPFEFHQADALEFLLKHGGEFDAIHASPPCQRYSVASKAHNGNADAHPDLVPVVRDILQKIGRPWIIENVIGAPLRNPVVLCGTMFDGLRVIRHRQFESSEKIAAPGACRPHPLCYTTDKRKPHYGRLDEMTAFVTVSGGGNCSKAAAADAMGIDWMTKDELNEAIPPAYTEYLGWQLRDAMMPAERPNA